MWIPTARSLNKRGVRVSALLIGFLVFLYGCAHHHKIPQGLTPEHINQNNSIVILSTGAKESSFSYSTGLLLRRMEDGKFVRMLPLSSWAVKSHFSDHHGFVSVLTLKPGRYFFTLEALHPYSWYEKPSSTISFEVRENEILYIGEFFWEFVQKPLAERLAGGGSGYAQLAVNDKFERDIEIFLNNNSSFKMEDIKKRIPGYTQQ